MAISQPKIVNVVISAWADKLNIERLARSLPKSMYEPETFSGLVYHRQVPKATIIMFSTGRIVTTGTKSVRKGNESLNVTMYELSNILKKDMKVKNKKIENIVIKSDIKSKIDLKKLSRKCQNSNYNKNVFPALIYINKPDPSCLVFGNGKIISAGSKNESQARQSIVNIHKKIILYRCCKA